jgi:hypothetical protein
MIGALGTMRTAFLVCVLSPFILCPCVFGQAALKSPTITATKPSPAIVIGFVGGFVRSDDLVHGTAQLGARLRSEYPSGVSVQVFQNHHENAAYREVLRLLDTDNDGTLSSVEKGEARIVIFGHSWGGSETVNLARQLEKDGIPVLLTIQVDSISKRGQQDGIIPPNVAQAANFYQPDGILHGRPEIRAADPQHTKIIGNFLFDYKAHPISCDQYPLRDRILTKTHTEIECDPKVWGQVETLIRSELRPLSDSH